MNHAAEIDGRGCCEDSLLIEALHVNLDLGGAFPITLAAGRPLHVIWGPSQFRVALRGIGNGENQTSGLEGERNAIGHAGNR